jgi:hypothetical protein
VYRILGCKSLGRRKSDEWVVWKDSVATIGPPVDAFDTFQVVVFLEDEIVVAAFERRPARWVHREITHTQMAVRESGGA